MTNIVFASSHACETRPLCGVAPKAEKYPPAVLMAEGYFFLSQALYCVLAYFYILFTVIAVVPFVECPQMSLHHTM